jgi:hypothetical protein
MSQQTDNAAAIIIIIDDTIQRLNAIKALDLANMRVALQDEIQAQLTDAQNCVIEAQELAS